jgi:hypothetical protein
VNRFFSVLAAATIHLMAFVAAAPSLPFAAAATGEEAPQSCESIKVEACTEFKGRARSYMGRAETRIWKIGSHRVYAMNGAAESARAELAKVNFHQDLFATFRVCPTSRHEKATMQNVCVEKISDAVFRSTGQ